MQQFFFIWAWIYVVARCISGQSHEQPDPKNGLPWKPGMIRMTRIAMGMKTDVNYFKKKLKEYNAYCESKTEKEMRQGAFIVLLTTMRLKILPASKLPDCTEDDSKVDQPDACQQTAGRVYGNLRKAALSGNGAEIALVLQKNGGNTFNLSPQQLVQLWGQNEHIQLHNVLCHPDAHKDPLPPLTDADKIFHAVHITSLSDGIGSNEYWSKKLPSDLGGYNNLGSWQERSWFESARAYEQLFPEAFQ